MRNGLQKEMEDGLVGDVERGGLGTVLDRDDGWSPGLHVLACVCSERHGCQSPRSSLESVASSLNVVFYIVWVDEPVH